MAWRDERARFLASTYVLASGSGPMPCSGCPSSPASFRRRPVPLHARRRSSALRIQDGRTRAVASGGAGYPGSRLRRSRRSGDEQSRRRRPAPRPRLPLALVVALGGLKTLMIGRAAAALALGELDVDAVLDGAEIRAIAYPSSRSRLPSPSLPDPGLHPPARRSRPAHPARCGSPVRRPSPPSSIRGSRLPSRPSSRLPA